MPPRPVIGLSPNLMPPAPAGAPARATYPSKTLEFVEAEMVRAVQAAGGLPVLLCGVHADGPEERAALAREAVSAIQGLLLTGGDDVDPATYGREDLAARWPGTPARDAWEIALYRAAVDLQRPVLGVCRGVQLINVAEGGTLFQDLPTQRKAGVAHRDASIYDRLTHTLEILAGSELQRIFAGGPAVVNSVHHQGLDQIGLALEVVARSSDGLPEAVERCGAPWVLGVQWHPEWMADSPAHQQLFRAFVAQALETAR